MVFEGICLEKRLGVFKMPLQNYVLQNIAQISSVRLFVKSSQIFDFLFLGPQNNDYYSVSLLILLPCQVSNLVFTTHKS